MRNAQPRPRGARHGIKVHPVGETAESLFDIYIRQSEMVAQLAVIQEQLKAVPDHEARIRVVEASRAKMIGAAVAASAVVSGLGTWIGLAVAHH